MQMNCLLHFCFIKVAMHRSDRSMASSLGIKSTSSTLSLSSSRWCCCILWQSQPQRNLSTTSVCRQSVLNAAAILVCNGRKYLISPLLRDLHWLRIPERIAFHLAVLVGWAQLLLPDVFSGAPLFLSF